MSERPTVAVLVFTMAFGILLSQTRSRLQELVLGKKIKVVPIIDEASLIRLNVFAELHTICQFHQNSKGYLPVILASYRGLIEGLYDCEKNS